MTTKQTITTKGRTRWYNLRPEANAAWQRDRFRTKLDSLGVDPHSKKNLHQLNMAGETLQRLEQEYQENLGTPLAAELKELIADVEEEISKLHSIAGQELVAQRMKTSSSLSKRSISHWSNNSRNRHGELGNEIIDMCIFGLIDPTQCLSVSLIPNHKPNTVSAIAYAKAVKKQLKRLCDFITRHGGIVVGVIEPFEKDPTCPHFHALVIVQNGSVVTMASKIRSKWRESHPGHKRAVVKSLQQATDVLRVLVYPHKRSKREIPDRLGPIGNRVITGGLANLPRLVEETHTVDSLICLAQYLQMCERRGIPVIDWRRLKFYSCENLINSREEALSYLIERWNQVIILGQTDAEAIEAWRILDVQYKQCADGLVRAVLSVFQGPAPQDWPIAPQPLEDEPTKYVMESQPTTETLNHRDAAVIDATSVSAERKLEQAPNNISPYSLQGQDPEGYVQERSEKSFKEEIYNRHETVDDP